MNPLVGLLKKTTQQQLASLPGTAESKKHGVTYVNSAGEETNDQDITQPVTTTSKRDPLSRGNTGYGNQRREGGDEVIVGHAD